MSKHNLFGTFVSILLLSGCANLNSIERRTNLPSGGKAIHLDAQQRVVISTSDGVICPEPSPDAIAAFAQSLGAGAGNLQGDSLSIASSIGSSVASFGLRTQSITLLRDIILQTCIQAANNQIGDTEVSKLLTKSMDLTALNLAIEQLTGATVGGQAALVSEATADGTSSVSNVSNLIKQENDIQLSQQNRLSAIREEIKLIEGEQSVLKAEQDKKSAEIGVLEATTEPASEAVSRATRIAILKKEQDELIIKQTRLTARLEGRRESATTLDEDIKKRTAVLAELSKSRDAAITSAAASISGEQRIIAGSRGSTISDQTAKVISNTVENMVKEYLKKDYTKETCLSLLSRDFEIESRTEGRAFRNASPEEQARIMEDVEKTEAEKNTVKTICLALLANEAGISLSQFISSYETLY